MSKRPTTKRPSPESDVRPEYDFSQGVRGKYAKSAQEGSNLVLLEPEVAAAFPDSDSVNRALRDLLAIAQRANAGKRARP